MLDTGVNDALLVIFQTVLPSSYQVTQGNQEINVDSHNRIMCFDIRDLGNQLKEIGMLIVQDAVWNRVSQNRERKVATRYYCDEFHLLLKEKQTVFSFLSFLPLTVLIFLFH